MNIVLFKSILLAVMAIVSMVFGLLPIKMIHYLNGSTQLHSNSALIISLLSCFAGGVFISVCFLDMLPDALESWDNARNGMNIDIDYPIVMLIALSSFFLVYLIEEVSTLCCDSAHSHSHSGSNEQIMRRARFSTVGSLFNPDGTFVKPRASSLESALENGGESRISRSIIFVSAFLLHVFLECFSFGVQENIKSSASLFIGITVHKAIVMFSIGMKLTRNHPIRWWIVVLLILMIALFNIIGGVVGIIIQSSSMNEARKELSSSILMSISLGTFIYISFFEMLGPERANNHSNTLQWLAAVLGFGLIAGIMAI